MGDTFPRFTVASVQAAPVLFDRDKTMDKALRLIEEAADKGAVIIGFPECYISGHPEICFLAKRTNPLIKMGDLFKELVKNGVKVPSPETDRLCRAAKKAGAYVVMGMSEVDVLYPGNVYISQLFISPQGEIMGVHRKIVTTVVEKLIYSPGDGSYLNVYDTTYGKLSALNCGEHAHDLVKYALLSMGTQIHVSSWPPFADKVYAKGQRDSVDFRVRQFAHAGKLFLINSCAVVDKSIIDSVCDTQEEKDNIVENTGGISSIIGPNGEYLAGPVYEGDHVLTAEVSLEDALPGKQVHNVLGHYSRWDVLSLRFNRQRLSPFVGSSSNVERSPHIAEELREIKGELHEIKQRMNGFSEPLKQ